MDCNYLTDHYFTTLFIVHIMNNWGPGSFCIMMILRFVISQLSTQAMLKSINKSIEMEAATDQSATANIHHHLMTTFGRAFWTTDITFGQKHGLNPPILLRTLVFLHIAITRSGISALRLNGGMERKA